VNDAAQPELSPARITAAVETAGLAPLATGVPEQFSRYFALLQKWNARLNLTAIRNPEGILARHFVECIFCAQNLPSGINTLLDYGSGAGFPGIPIALCRPAIRVTLAESQGKKAGFLREAVRVLGIEAEVYAGRVEDMPQAKRFDAVSLRAVDKMQAATNAAAFRVDAGGWLVLLASAGGAGLPTGFTPGEIPLPGAESRALILAKRTNVPRETSSHSSSS
jgi:16S rRNA (guanine527-N7)-methyltransferase